MDMRIPPLKVEIMLESNPPKSRILVRRLAVPESVAIKIAVATVAAPYPLLLLSLLLLLLLLTILLSPVRITRFAS